ncbi:hypothetical protein JW887_00370 [Candidatus Dojkabacteria bacterium]|nr:hypothetical protein [Candidatus Dojkabacteria bacterium]
MADQNKKGKSEMKDNKSKKSSVNVLVSLLIAILALIVGCAGGALVLWLVVNFSKDAFCSEYNVPEVSDSEDISEPESNNDDNEYIGESYKLLVDDGYVTVPEGWKVTEVDSYFDYLSDSEIAEIGLSGGAWPIHDYNQIVISNDDASITYERQALYVPGGFGGTSSMLNDSFTVVVEPTEVLDYDNSDSDMYGFAVKEVNSNEFEYHIICINEYYDPASSNPDESEFFDLSAGLEVYPILVLEGDETYKNVAETFLAEACIENSSGWCEQ